MAGDAPATHAKAVLDAFNAALASNDADALCSCFYSEQAYWRDIVALTSHLRTIENPRIVAAALLEMIALRGLASEVELKGAAQFAVMSPVMVSSPVICREVLDLVAVANDMVKMFIDCGISFCTSSPSLDCMGKMVLLPVKSEGAVSWKIWVLSTWVERLIQHPEDEKLLLAPSRKLAGVDAIETDVMIVGAGTS